MYPVDAIMEHARSVPPPPQALGRLMELLATSDHDLSDVARVLSADAVLAARVLETANSAYYGRAGGVASVQRALLTLGEREVMRIAVTECARVLRSRDLHGYCLDAQSLWIKSLYTALFAEALAGLPSVASLEADGVSPQVAYTAGLLLDIGKLGLDHFIGLALGGLNSPEASGGDQAQRLDAIDGVNPDDPFDALERTCIGTDHAQLGAKMAESWGIPEPLCQAIAHHHSPLADVPLTKVAHCADALALSLVGGGGIDGMSYPLSEDCLADIGVDDAELDRMILQTSFRVAELQEQLQ